MRAIRVLWVILSIALLGFLGVLPPEGSAQPETLQAISLAYPLRQRYKITSLYDHTGPGQAADNQIQIHTGALVRNDPGAGDECSSGGLWSYTDGDTNLWNLRWDQDTPCAGGGPGWLWYDGHGGYDLACPNNTPVNAARQGTARLPANDVIYIEHGTDYRTYYRHLSAQLVNPGENVQVGREIGRSGVGGTGAHLHFEVRRLSGGVWTYVDPYGWEQGNLWAGGEPFPLGYVDQNNTPHGPFQLDNTKI
ncbi:MAG: M23 family metallopeptidase, partial [Anaerolineae bacterium]